MAYGTKEEVKNSWAIHKTVALTLDRVPAGFDEVEGENGIQFCTWTDQRQPLTIDQTIFLDDEIDYKSNRHNSWLNCQRKNDIRRGVLYN